MNRDPHPRDGGGTILGWLVKLAVTLGVVGVIVMDAFSLGSTWTNMTDAADGAALAASQAAMVSGGNVDQAVAAARSSLQDTNPDYRLDTRSVEVLSDRAVRLTIHRTAHTIVLHRIKQLAHFGEFTTTVTRRSTGT